MTPIFEDCIIVLIFAGLLGLAWAGGYGWAWKTVFEYYDVHPRISYEAIEKGKVKP